MSEQPHQRVPIWKQLPVKPSFWKRTVKPFLLISIVFVAWLVLRMFPVSSGLKYIGSIVTLLVAVGAFTIKNYPEYKKTGRFSPPAVEAVTTLGAVFLALITIGGTWTGDQETQKKAVEDAAAKSKQERISDDLQAREIAVAQGEKLLALQAEENRREELANAASHAADIKLQEKITQALTREEASRNRQAQKDAISYLRTVAIENHVAEATAILKGFQATAQGFHENAVGIERTLNPIQSLGVAYRVQVPLDDPQMEHYRADLDKAVQDFLANGKKINGSSPFTKCETVKFNKPSSVDVSLFIRRGSILYPTDSTLLRANLFNYPVEVRFWKKLFRYDSGFIGGSVGSSPELFIITAADRLPPDVFYDLTRKKLYFFYHGAILPVGSYQVMAPGGLSLSDLKGDKVAISQDEMTGFDTPSSVDFKDFGQLASLKRKYRIDLVEMGISDKLFIFGVGGNKWTYFKTPHGVEATFTFDDNLTSYGHSLSHLDSISKRSSIP